MNATHTNTGQTRFTGKHAETIVTVNGQQWQISTGKNYTGALASTARKVSQKEENGFMVTSYAFTGAEQPETLITERLARVTEKAIRAQHEKALLIFDVKKDTGEITTEAPAAPVVGSVLFLDGYGEYKGSRGNNWIVYEIAGDIYHAIEQDSHEIRTFSYVRPYAEKFGIGVYFSPDFNFKGSEDDLANMVISAQIRAEEAAKAEAAAAEAAKIERLQKIETGRELVDIPEGATAVIIAELYEDESDSQTDYFHTRPVEIVYLELSKSRRNNPAELKKAAAKFDKTAALLDHPGATIDKGYNGLPSYYFGTSSWSGWKVSKIWLTDNEITRLHIAAAEGRSMIAPAPETHPEPTQPVPAENLKFEIIDYSEKAVAIFGDTYEIKDQLKKIGAKFNRFLKKDGAIAAGWILPKAKKHLLNLPKNG